MTPLSPREADLLGRIAEAPDDIDARRVLADLWIEGGDEARATLVHAMCEHKRAVVDAIIAEHHRSWCSPLLAAGFRYSDLVFEAGFMPGLVFVDPDPLLASPEGFRLSPVHYRLREAMDGDEFTVVHEATRFTATTSGEQCAVRVPRERLSRDGEDVIIARELAILRRVAGPHVVELFGSAIMRAGPAVATRWAGEALDTIIEASRGGNETLAISVGIQLCDACASVHAANVVHAFIRPDHVMVRDGHVTLGGFGNAMGELVSRPHASARGRQRSNRFAHMSPEQVIGRQLTPASDVFSIALVVAELATGRHPLPPIDSEFDTLVAIRDAVHHVPQTTSALGGILQSVLVRHPAARPSIASFAEQLRGIAR